MTIQYRIAKQKVDKGLLDNLMRENFRRMDYSNFGVWNIITAFSSQENDFNKRNKI